MKRFFTMIISLCTLGCAQAFNWYTTDRPVIYHIVGKTAPVVEIALQLFRSDIKDVTDKEAVPGKNACIEIYELDKASSSTVNSLKTLGVPTDNVQKDLDGFYLGVKKGKIIIAGNNGRGTAYGILELSRKAGVSPWVWWGDVKPQKQSQLTLPDNFETYQSPSVSYRGIFLNDEDWTTRNWAGITFEPELKYGTIGPKTYRKIFELLLRLRANAIWPGMHTGTTAFFKVPGNREIADSCGILVGASHCEPLLRNNVDEWDVKERGAYNFISNREQVVNYWTERLKEVKGGEYFFTIGMRGIHDGSMEGVKTKKEKLEGLQAVIDCQRELIKQHFRKDVERVPQVFIPYKEVLEIYESGLNVPEDVTLMWCDDNYGYMTRLSDAEQQKRSGGGGVYYHLSYWGRPHDYMWLTTQQPGLTYSEMRQAYDHNAKKLWIVNVHDPKVAAYDLEFFLDMAWNIDAIRPESIQEHLGQWLCTQFGTEVGRQLLPVMTEFYRLNGIRRPEFMGWSQVELDKTKYPRGRSQVIDTEFTTAFGNELDRYLQDYQALVDAVERIAQQVRPELRDAYFAAIKYPVEGAAAMATKLLEAQKARALCMGQCDESINTRQQRLLTSTARSLGAYYKIRSLTDYYNNEMADGKWRGNMNFMPRDLNVFNGPILPMVPTPEEIVQYNKPDTRQYPIDTDGATVCNACDYTEATAGVQKIQMLGHSMNAVSVPKGGSLIYEINLSQPLKGVLHTAVIPTQANDKGDIRYSVSIDAAEPTVYSLKEPYRSERWKLNVMRGQAIRTLDVDLPAGHHTLTITALDDHIIIDQWMLDPKADRKFYVFPVKSAL
ncbi:MAG: glycosyl hydrolase 115 family protein [Bacteroidaceae bacterium]|nr:glycosyl hydrolase 115 family protein [Bacteroidaceae bacterium]